MMRSTSQKRLLGLARHYAHASGAEQAVTKAAKTAGKYTVLNGESFSDFVKSKLNVLVAGAVGLVVVNIAATKGYTWIYKRSVLTQLEEGLLPPASPPAPLPRSSLQQELQGILRPERPSRFYCIITGPEGSGKTTLIRQACRRAGPGIGYIDVHPAFEVDFGQDLGQAFNFRFEKHKNLLNIVTQAVVGRKMVDTGGKHPLSTLRQSVEALKDAAIEYRKRTGRPFVLVIDSVERLMRDQDKGEKSLQALIEYAKDFAQEGIISIVFVSSDFNVVKKLTGNHPTSSRAAAPVLVGDLTLHEALQYMQYLEVPPHLAPKLVELVGGSLALVERAAGMHIAGADFNIIKSRLMDLVELEYQASGLLSATEQQESGLLAVEALVKSQEGSIPVSEWRSLVKEQQHRHVLLQSGVFHSDGKQVKFGSRLAALYATERLKNTSSRR